MPEPRDLVEEALVSIADNIAFPSEPDIAAVVRRRITHPVVIPTIAPRRSLLRFAVAALVLAIAATGVLLFSPAARDAVAGWLGLPGIRITTGETSPPPTVSTQGGLYLGRPTSLARAERALGAPVRLPALTALGSPQAVYADPVYHIVWLAYGPAPGLPRLAGRDLGLLVTEIKAHGVEDYFYKKMAGAGQVRNVRVDGYRGFWIHGQPHTILYRFPLGTRIEAGRVSGNALIWVEGPITYRIELNAGLGKARAVAASLR